MQDEILSLVRRLTTVATVVVGASAAVACGASSVATPPATTAASITADDDDATVGLWEHHRYHHHGGVTLLIAMSLDTLGVSAEQRAAVDKIRVDLHARMELARTAEQNLEITLAEGLGATSFEAPKVDAAVAQVTAAASGVHDASADALNELHAVLTPPQRAALVDKVEAHWAVWQKANVERTGAHADGDHLSTLASDLDLTADQVDKIRAGLGEQPPMDPKEVAAHLHAFGEAFRTETFDAKGLTGGGVANARLAGWGATHMAHFVETVGPVLTPPQRDKLAKRLRDHAAHNPSAEGKP